MKQVKKKFGNYELEYLLQPGLWMSETEVQSMKRDLDHVNRISGSNLEYGIFDPSNDRDQIRKFLAQANFCVMRLNGEAAGFFYNVILEEKPVPAIHAGLVVIAKNTGVDLLRVPYAYMALLQRRKWGTYYYTNISSTPSIIGTFSDLFSDVWPNYKGAMVKPPSKHYVHILNLLSREYIHKYFPADQVIIDTKRFVMRSPQKEMGFEQDPRKLSRYHKLEANLFCIFWLDYTKGEDIVQVGKVDRKFALKTRLQLLSFGIRGFVGQLFARKQQGSTQLPIAAVVDLPLHSAQLTRHSEQNQSKAA